MEPKLFMSKEICYTWRKKNTLIYIPVSLNTFAIFILVGVAQLAERQIVVLDVVGSNPIIHL